MRLPLILRIFKNNQLKEVKQLDQDQVVIGHNADVHIDLDGEKVSAIHCLIEKRDQNYYICDLGSQSGTFKNGQAILDEQIESGDEIFVGEFKLQFFVGAPKPKVAPPAMQTSPVAKIVPANVVEVKKEEIRPEKTIEPEAPVEAASVSPSLPKSMDLKANEAEAPKAVVTKPDLKKSIVSSKKKKGQATFAPPSHIKDIRSHLNVGKGINVEILVIWGDRILNTYNYSKKTIVKVGHGDANECIPLPDSFLKEGFPVLDLRNGVRVQANHEIDISIKVDDAVYSESENRVNSRVQAINAGKSIRLEQNEIIFLSNRHTAFQIAVRFAPQPPNILMLPPAIFSASELSAVIVAVVLMGLLKFYIDSTIPDEWAVKEQEEVQRIAQVIFNAPPPTPKAEKPPEEEVKPPPPPPPKPPERVKVAEQSKETSTKGEQNKAATGKAQVAARANEVAPKPNSKNRPKSFTSVKQGGAIKTGEKAGANAQSANKDPNKVGLLSAFGAGGVRKQIDQAYSGSGELLGMADRATGASGFNENRAGDDLGSKFKDTGAGGKGTATQGIAGIGTKGRASGMSAYGASDGFGDKTSVNVQSGGTEESFVGTIDREAIRRVIRARIGEVKSCYERVLNTLPKGQKLEGKVVIKWEIVAQGQARNAKVKSTTLNNATVESCIVSRLQSWVFPEPPTNTIADIEYPFVLNQTN